MKPEVSVIIPAYNCSRTIKQAIDSALCQDVISEIIVINDCSPEDLTECLAEYKSNPQVRLYKNETNLGVAATRNKGVQLAEGEYVAFLDSDDIWRSGKLSKQLAVMKKTGVVFLNCQRTDGRGRNPYRTDLTGTGEHHLQDAAVWECDQLLIRSDEAGGGSRVPDGG